MAYKYWSTQRPVAPGTFPKPNGNKVTFIHNFNKRRFWGPIEREAWGWIEYEKELTEKEWKDYELIPEPGQGSEWVVFFRDEMEPVDDDDCNLAYMLVPTSWLISKIDDYSDWIKENTADSNAGLYYMAKTDDMILSICRGKENDNGN